MAPYRHIARSVRKGTNAPRDRAWQAMRILRRFDVPQVCAAAEIHRVSLMRFLGGLQRCGYVRKRSNGRGGRHEHAVYQLVRDTGPFRPWLQSNGTIYDRNVGREFPPQQVIA